MDCQVRYRVRQAKSVVDQYCTGRCDEPLQWNASNNVVLNVTPRLEIANYSRPTAESTFSIRVGLSKERAAHWNRVVLLMGLVDRGTMRWLFAERGYYRLRYYFGHTPVVVPTFTSWTPWILVYRYIHAAGKFTAPFVFSSPCMQSTVLLDDTTIIHICF